MLLCYTNLQQLEEYTRLSKAKVVLFTIFGDSCTPFADGTGGDVTGTVHIYSIPGDLFTICTTAVCLALGRAWSNKYET